MRVETGLIRCPGLAWRYTARLSVLATSAAVATAILLALCAPASATTPFTGTLAGAGELTLAGSATPSDETVGLLTAVSNTSVVPSTTAAGATGVAYNGRGSPPAPPASSSSRARSRSPAPAGHLHRRELHGLRRHRHAAQPSAPASSPTTAPPSCSGVASSAPPPPPATRLRSPASPARPTRPPARTASPSRPRPTRTPVTTTFGVRPARRAGRWLAASVVPSTTAAGATGVGYTVGFTTSFASQLQFPDTITLTAPAGPSRTPTSRSSTRPGHPATSAPASSPMTARRSCSGSAARSTTAPGDFPRGAHHRCDQLDRRSTHLRHSTSDDADAVTTPSYTLVAAQPVSSTSVVPSTTAAGATGVLQRRGSRPAPPASSSSRGRSR